MLVPKILFNILNMDTIWNTQCGYTTAYVHPVGKFYPKTTYTYIIGHYNLSVRIIDLVSHNTYVVCVNFIHKWQELQFKVDSEIF